MIEAAMNSSKFIVNFPCIDSGSSYLQARPLMLNPPIPTSQASDTVISVGVVKVILLMEMPSLEHLFRSVDQSSRSSRTPGGMDWGPMVLHFDRRCRIRFMK